MELIESSGWYELFFEVLYRVKGKNENVEKVNSSLREFRAVLENFIIKEDLLEIRVNCVDEFHAKRVDAGTLICSQKIKFEVLDDRHDWAHRRNLEIEPLIHNTFRKIKFKAAHFGYRFHFQVIDSIFQGEAKSPSWPPDEHFAIVAKPPDYAGDLAEMEKAPKVVASLRKML